MNASGIILVLVIAYILYYILEHGMPPGLQLGGALPQMTIRNRYQDPYYARQYRELEDVDNVLNRPLYPADPVIQKLEGRRESMHNEQELRTPVKTYFDFAATERPTKNTKEDTKVLVEARQPYFLDDALIIDRDGEKYYWDTRYPRRPISIDFAKDPMKYIKERPNEYPSYVIASRNYGDLVEVDLLA